MSNYFVFPQMQENERFQSPYESEKYDYGTSFSPAVESPPINQHQYPPITSTTTTSATATTIDQIPSNSERLTAEENVSKAIETKPTTEAENAVENYKEKTKEKDDEKDRECDDKKDSTNLSENNENESKTNNTKSKITKRLLNKIAVSIFLINFVVFPMNFNFLYFAEHRWRCRLYATEEAKASKR